MAAITVIVPVYNDEAYIAECLASIERQTLKDIEVICVDDGSSDRSVEICQQFAQEDKRIQLVCFSENRGVAAARNHALDLAQGEFVAFMDSDDWYPDDTCLENLYTAATAHSQLVAGGSIDLFDEAESVVKPPDVESDPHLVCFTFDTPGIVEYRDWQFDYGFYRFIYKRDLINENGIRFPELVRHEDPVFMVKALVAAGTFYAVPKTVYRLRVGYKETKFSEKDLNDAFEGISRVIAVSVDEDLPTLREWQKYLLLWYYHQTDILGEFRMLEFWQVSRERIAGHAASLLSHLIGRSLS